jgi:hypothetical protein
MGWVVNATPRPLYPQERDPVSIVQEAGWAPGPVWTGAENLAPTGFEPRTVRPVASGYTDCKQRSVSVSMDKEMSRRSEQPSVCVRVRVCKDEVKRNSNSTETE